MKPVTPDQLKPQESGRSFLQDRLLLFNTRLAGVNYIREVMHSGGRVHSDKGSVDLPNELWHIILELVTTSEPEPPKSAWSFVRASIVAARPSSDPDHPQGRTCILKCVRHDFDLPGDDEGQRLLAGRLLNPGEVAGLESFLENATTEQADKVNAAAEAFKLQKQPKQPAPEPGVRAPRHPASFGYVYTEHDFRPVIPSLNMVSEGDDSIFYVFVGWEHLKSLASRLYYDIKAADVILRIDHDYQGGCNVCKSPCECWRTGYDQNIPCASKSQRLFLVGRGNVNYSTKGNLAREFLHLPWIGSAIAANSSYWIACPLCVSLDLGKEQFEMLRELNSTEVDGELQKRILGEVAEKLKEIGYPDVEKWEQEWLGDGSEDEETA
ncbi:hypothetical protein QBC44DRAFT_400080 [Cladorrhinum sp. PSN332]|nr:hypothetical protein QBC44DRAFT_400080 [Cladorrhinum sp. PSN332]